MLREQNTAFCHTWAQAWPQTLADRGGGRMAKEKCTLEQPCPVLSSAACLAPPESDRVHSSANSLLLIQMAECVSVCMCECVHVRV